VAVHLDLGALQAGPNPVRALPAVPVAARNLFDPAQSEMAFDSEHPTMGS
jgi:hypothetical protein